MKINKLGIIGGSGLAEWQELESRSLENVTSDYGVPSSALVHSHIGNQEIVFLARHGNPHVIPPHCINYRANINALQKAGVSHIIGVNAVGGISDEQQTGVICLPDQVIDYTWGRKHTFSDSAIVPLEHVDFTYPYCDELRMAIHGASESLDFNVLVRGTLGVTQGPRLETAAEVVRLRNDGCDMVGMTGMPEAALAREAGIEYVALTLVVNRAAGLTEGLISMADIEEAMRAGIQDVKSVISAFCHRA